MCGCYNALFGRMFMKQNVAAVVVLCWHMWCKQRCTGGCVDCLNVRQVERKICRISPAGDGGGEGEVVFRFWRELCQNTFLHSFIRLFCLETHLEERETEREIQCVHPSFIAVIKFNVRSGLMFQFDVHKIHFIYMCCSL